MGIRNATQEWIAILDSDDEWRSDKLYFQKEAIESNPQCKIVHTNEKWIRNGNEVSKPKYLDKSNHELFSRSLYHCLICPSSSIIRKDFLLALGLFDETFPVCEDYDLWLRILIRSIPLLIEEECTIKYGGHLDQLSASRWGFDLYRVQAMEKLLADKRLSANQRKQVLSVLHQMCKILESGFFKRNKENK